MMVVMMTLFFWEGLFGQTTFLWTCVPRVFQQNIVFWPCVLSITLSAIGFKVGMIATHSEHQAFGVFKTVEEKHSVKIQMGQRRQIHCIVHPKSQKSTLL